MINRAPKLSRNMQPEIIYWRNKLNEATPLLNLATDRPRSLILSEKAKIGNSSLYRTQASSISQEVTLVLKEVARTENTSVAVILLSAFQVLLYRYSGGEDIVVGYLNCYADSQLDILPIRTSVKGEQKFSQLLADNQNQIATGLNYTAIALATLTETLETGNSQTSLYCLSQILFEFNSLAATSTIKARAITPQELGLTIIETADSLICNFKYNANLFDAATVRRIADNYQTLLKSIATKIDTVDALSLISARERSRILFDWNQTQAKFVPQCLHQLFEAQVERDSSATAAICRGESLTYGELNQKANQLAHYLQTKGVTSGSLVGLCIERSLEMVVAVLAILKAGGAYVPLDLSNPTARIAFILEDTQAKILLTQESLRSKLPAQIEQTICIDRDWHSIAQQSVENLNLTTKVEDLAHIVYTSGSTGKPKGVMLSHGNLSHYAQSLQSAFDITPGDVYLHRGSIALIVSARQLLMPLAQGATAVIVSKEETKDPLGLFELIKRHGVTIVDHVPSFWRNFWGILHQQTDSRADLLDNKVRLVAAGGEQVTPEIYQCWRETFKPHVKLANIYGQTEGTGVVTVYPIPERLDRRFKSLPVGRPIPNMRVYLLDERLQPVPIGVTSEIHISGRGVAQGYLNRPELTAEKFVPNPYVEGERLYKTGDLGRYLPDGSIQFLGRRDRQVNIQGLRIELGEIEAVLSQHPLVQEAAVVVRENRLGETLFAYIVPSIGSQPTIEMLRGYLLEKLPSYMIPNGFSFMEEFPQTTSGKVDRRTLSTLDLAESSPAIPPNDELEAEIVQMLQGILGIASIGIQDNFIELGGNSLLAARLVTEIEHRYKQQIPLSQVFQASTPQTLAKLIRQDEQVNYPPSFVPIKQGNSQLKLFCIHNLGYGLEFYRPLAKYLSDDLSLYGLSSSFDNDPNKPHFRDIANSAAYYVRHLQQIQPQGPYYLLAVSFGGVIAYEIAQRLVSQGHEVRFLGLLDTYCPQQDATFEPPPVKERISGHLQRIRSKGGTNHIYKRVKWRIDAAMDNLRYGLYQIDWVKENLFDPTNRDLALIQYKEQLKEHKQVNQGYEISPYPGKICLFRATDDVNTKLGWQDLALSGLSIYDISGGHIEILTEPVVEILAQKIELALQEH